MLNRLTLIGPIVSPVAVKTKQSGKLTICSFIHEVKTTNYGAETKIRFEVFCFGKTADEMLASTNNLNGLWLTEGKISQTGDIPKVTASSVTRVELPTQEVVVEKVVTKIVEMPHTDQPTSDVDPYDVDLLF